jgi:hypothetical protein
MEALKKTLPSRAEHRGREATGDAESRDLVFAAAEFKVKVLYVQVDPLRRTTCLVGMTELRESMRWNKREQLQPASLSLF